MWHKEKGKNSWWLQEIFSIFHLVFPHFFIYFKEKFFINRFVPILVRLPEASNSSTCARGMIIGLSLALPFSTNCLSLLILLGFDAAGDFSAGIKPMSCPFWSCFMLFECRVLQLAIWCGVLVSCGYDLFLVGTQSTFFCHPQPATHRQFAWDSYLLPLGCVLRHVLCIC